MANCNISTTCSLYKWSAFSFCLYVDWLCHKGYPFIDSARELVEMCDEAGDEEELVELNALARSYAHDYDLDPNTFMEFIHHEFTTEERPWLAHLQ